MGNHLRILALVSAAAVLTSPASAQERADRQERETRRRMTWVSSDDDRPRLGISTSSGSRRDTLGLLVTGVTENGAAAKAGIEEGDRIAAINGVNLRLSPQDAGEEDMANVAQRRLIRELEKHKAGDEVELRIYSNGQWKTVKAMLAEPADIGFGGATVRALREERENRAVLGIGFGMSGSRRDTLGILVSSVTEDGPAEKAGIEEGDRVASINGVDLRVAREDAGDWSASSSRVRRVNREMEKVKAGDAVELRVYRDGQTRAVKVTTMKAADLRGGDNAFFFGDGAAGLVLPRIARPPEVPVPPVAPRAPRAPLMFRWNDDGEVRLRLDPQLRADVEEGMRGLERGMIELRRAMPRIRLRPLDELDDEGAPSAWTTPSPGTRAAPAIAAVRAEGAVGPRMAAPAVLPASYITGDWDDGTIRINGMKLAKVDGDLASYFGTGSERGLLVLDAGDRWEGLRQGDIVLRIDGRDVRSGDRVHVAIGGGSRHDVEVIRNGKAVSIRVPSSR